MWISEQEAGPSAFAISCLGACQEPFLFAAMLILTFLATPVMLISKQIKLHIESTLCDFPPPTPVPETKTGLLSIPLIMLYFTFGGFSGNYNNYWKFSTSWKLEASPNIVFPCGAPLKCGQRAQIRGQPWEGRVKRKCSCQ